MNKERHEMIVARLSNLFCGKLGFLLILLLLLLLLLLFLCLVLVFLSAFIAHR